MGFKQIIELLRAGEPVAAGTTNRPIRDIQQNAEYLWELIKAAAIGSTIYARQVTLAPSVLEGQPVFYNDATQRFEAAYAAVSTDLANGRISPAASAQVWGIVATKTNSTLGDILLSGYDTIDITNALTGASLAAGMYFLGLAPGTLTKTRPGVPIPVLRADGNGKVFLSPQWDDPIFRYVPFKFRLAPIPAGTHTDPGDGGTHVITSPNVHVRGWLPADHASFEDRAPSGAKFGYNLLAHPELKAVWPPLPPESATLFWEGVLTESGIGGFVQFTRYGIWWMSDCYGDVPWPATLSTEFEAVSESTFSESINACPFPYEMRLTLFFSQVSFMSETTVVTSLVTEDSRIKIFCEGKDDVPARLGPLQIALDLSFLSDDVDPGGYLVFKSFDAETQKFHRGPAVVGMWTPNANVNLTGTTTVQRTINDIVRTVHVGDVSVDFDTSFNRELPVQLVRLDGATEEFFEDVMFLGFPAEEETRLRGRIHIPESLDLSTPKLRLRLRLFGRAAGNLPQLTVTGRRIPAASTPTSLPTTDSTITIDTTETLSGANQYVDVLSDPITIAAGDDFLFFIQREADDAYVNQVGIIRMAGIIVAGS